MAKAKKKGGAGGKKPSASSSSFKYAIRDNRGRFVKAEDKEREMKGIQRIQKEFPELKTTKEINKVLYSDRTFTESFETNGLDSSVNLRTALMDKPAIEIITTEGKRVKFNPNETDKAEAFFNEQMSNLWRDATKRRQKEEEAHKRKKRDAKRKGLRPPRKKMSDYIPAFRTESVEQYSGKRTKVVYDFSNNNVTGGAGVDMKQFKSKRK